MVPTWRQEFESSWRTEGHEISDRQWNDILGVLKLQGERLDFNYMKPCAAELGVEDLFDRARQEVFRQNTAGPLTREEL
jgi:hypothetical protein